MIVCADTSALLKKYIPEKESEALIKALQTVDDLYTSSLTELELASAFEVAKRTHRLNSPSYRNVLAMSERDFSGEVIKRVAMSQDILLHAKKLIRTRKLRAPDSIQLATALEINRQSPTKVPFICCDIQLIEAARLEGLKVIDLK